MTSPPFLRPVPITPDRPASWLAVLICGAAACFRVLRHGIRLMNDRRAIRQLAELDNHLLKDIGLTHGQVLGALSEPLHRAPSRVLVQDTRRERAAPHGTCRGSRPSRGRGA